MSSKNAAIRSFHSNGPVRPEADVLIGLPKSLVNANDTEIVSFVEEYLDINRAGSTV